MEYNMPVIKEKGSITIYLLMSLVLMMAMICTLAESARVNCLNAKLRGITYMAADSCFAEFASEVFDEYGVMALWKDEAEFTADFNDYVRSNLKLTGLDIYWDADLLQASFDASAIENIQWITDDNGMVFTEQVCDYMLYFLSREAMEKILENFTRAGAGQKVAAFIEKINQYQDVFLKVGNSVTKIQQATDRVKSVAYNPKTILGDMKENLENYEASGNVLYVAQFDMDYWSLRMAKNQYESNLETIQTESQNYYDGMAKAEAAIADLEEQLNLTEDEYSDEAVEAIRTQLEDLRLKSADKDADYYKVSENLEKANEYSEKIKSLNLLINEIGTGTSGQELIETKDTIDFCRAAFASFDVDELGLNASEEAVQVEDTGFISTISDIFNNGLLAAMTDGHVSGKSIDTAELPSKTVQRSGSGGGILSSTYKKVMLGEYALEYFGNYLDPKEDTALKYEAEYILAGKNNDKDNLEAVVRDLVLLRSGLNMMSFAADSSKMSEVQTLSHAIIGWTGLEFLVQIIASVVISIWCLAEALCDVKAIMSGGKISLIKNPAEWSISAIGLKNFSKSIVPAASSDSGLEYKEYLGLMLLTEGLADEAYRTMDMIQANMCKNHNSLFRMSGCISSIKLQASYSAAQMFSSFGFVKKLVGNGNGRYGFTYAQEYSY